MRHLLNETAKAIFDRHVEVAVQGGCDRPQAESIARERYLRDVVASSNASHEINRFRLPPR